MAVHSFALPSSEFAAVADDQAKDADNLAWLSKVAAADAAVWVDRLAWVRIIDRYAEGVMLGTVSSFTQYEDLESIGVDERRGLAILAKIARSMPESPLHAGLPPLGGWSDEWARYLRAVLVYHEPDVALRDFASFETMLVELGGSVFRLFPFLDAAGRDWICDFGALDQAYNVLRDLSEDLAQGLSWIPRDAFARAGVKASSGARAYREVVAYFIEDYLPRIAVRAQPFLAMEDLHPSLVAMREDCMARYQRIETCYRRVGFDYEKFHCTYWPS